MTRDLAELLLLCLVLTPGISPPRMLASARAFHRIQRSGDQQAQVFKIGEIVSVKWRDAVHGRHCAVFQFGRDRGRLLRLLEYNIH